MSDETLRDRIAKVLDQNFNPDQYPIMAVMFRDYAQAIIDELGLTVETQGGFDLVNYRDQIVRTEERSRYVTPWTHVADAAQVGERRNGKDVWFEGWEKQ